MLWGVGQGKKVIGVRQRRPARGRRERKQKRKEKLTTKSLEHLQFNDLQSLVISTIKKERKHKFGDVMSSRSDLR